jgi:hypothetical protein
VQVHADIVGTGVVLHFSAKKLDFLLKSFLDPQHVIYSLNRWGKIWNPHRLDASGSFRALSFHVGLKLGVTNSKKIKKM